MKKGPFPSERPVRLLSVDVRSRDCWRLAHTQAAVLVAAWLLSAGLRARAEDQFQYKFEEYLEEGGRMEIQTHSAAAEENLASWLSLREQFVYDAISGATPTGAPPPPGSSQVPLVEMTDLRTAGTFESQFTWGRNTTTPQFAYSLENDYRSIGLSLNHSINFNQKNTTLSFGIAHDFDEVFPAFWRGNQRHKDSTDAMIGLTQLLSPKSVLSLAFTFGTSSGYLNDPYRGVHFDGYPDPNALFDENRPAHRTQQVFYSSFTQFVTPANGSVELSYRFYHDSFDVFSHTASLGWFQKVGSHLVLAPFFRYYEQSAASFYGPRFSGDPSDPGAFPGVVIPTFYSADYRLAHLQSFTYGISALVKIRSWLDLDVGYQRYQMQGLDHVTAASSFPTANIVTAGLRLWF